MIEHLYAALASPLGIILETDDIERLRQRLYAVRKSLADPALDNLSLVQSPLDPNHLWIVKRKKDDPA